MNKKRLFFILTSGLVTLSASATDFKGRVCDSQHNPVAFANVSLLNAQDSTFLCGAVTDVQGAFTLSVNSTEACLLKVSCMGYVTSFLADPAENVGTIQLKENATALKGVTVKAGKPVVRMKGGDLTTTVQHTMLSRLGTAEDVLQQLPFITTSEGKINVIGRGKPAIYINNRLVTDDNEITRLKSDMVKEVRIDLNPVSRYGADVPAVVKITTLRPVGEGWGGELTAQGAQGNTFNHYESADLTFHKKRTDLFLSAYFMQNKRKQRQSVTNDYLYKSSPVKASTAGSLNFGSKDLYFSAGLNQQLTDKQSLGIQYEFDKSFDGQAYTAFDNLFSLNGREERFRSWNDMTQGGYSHYVNTFYRNEFTRDNALNVDATFKYANNSSTSSEQEEREDSYGKVDAANNADTYLGALRVWQEFGLWKGRVEVGAEGTYTDNKQSYHMLNGQVAAHLPSNDNEARQSAGSGFLTYEKGWNAWTVKAGVRYEYVSYDYYLNGQRKVEQSRDYSHLFPTLSAGYQQNGLSLQLAYRAGVTRPSYFQLRSDIVYDNSFTYEGGNPSLRPTYSQEVSLLGVYKDFQWNLSYSWLKDDILFYEGHFKDEPIVLVTQMNHDRQKYDFNLSYTPTFFGCWKPSLMAGLSGQVLSLRGRTYNNPGLVYAWKNLISLPRQWMIGLNLEGSSYMDSQLFSRLSAFNSSFMLQKRWKHIECTVGVEDIFNTGRERWVLHYVDMAARKWSNPGMRNVYVRLVYRFNPSDKSYQGGQSGLNEQKRF